MNKKNTNEIHAHAAGFNTPEDLAQQTIKIAYTIQRQLSPEQEHRLLHSLLLHTAKLHLGCALAAENFPPYDKAQLDLVAEIFDTAGYQIHAFSTSHPS